MESHILLFLHYLLFLYMLPVSTSLDSISSVQSIRGEETLVSAGGTFELGFFSPGNSKNWYLGIWYKEVSVRTVVWVANRENPLANSSGTLKLSVLGNLNLVSQNESIIWYSNSSRLARMPVAQLLNSGNLVVRDGNDNDPGAFLWQSFDHPCDTLLPGMKLGRNKTTGFDRILTSWKSPEDPSPGSFTFRVETNGYPQLVLSQGSVIRYRTGPWNGIRSSGMRDVKENWFLLSENEMYYELLNSSVLLRMVLSSNGVIQRYMLSDPAQGWSLYLAALIDNCDAYALCGTYGSCNVDNSPLCQCMSGFVPKSVEERGAVDWSNGCNRRTPLDCKGDVFFKYSDVKLPDAQRSWFNMSLNLEECRMICEKNCTCTAYANLNIEREGSGCLLWFGDLIDVQEHALHGQDLYIRMASSESVRIFGEGSKHNKKKQVPIIVSTVSAGMLVIGFGLIVYILRKKQRLNRQEGDPSTKIQKEDLELPLFDFTTIEIATNNFSTENKLGEGGFGPVYKGILKEGQEIAVKRLSRNSRQGLTEFMNEVLCIAKLQHRNLVKLLGCCIQEEKMLLYELMPNKSLDFFIFDQREREILKWQKRFHIITGIGRGLLYLHQDSQLRIVNRDLKASNVLLDHEMNPKISDFGLARSFGGNETKANTNRVVGT